METEFNTLGYELITEGKFNDAIAVFKIEVQLYPNSWNAYDSLAESYMKAGDKDLAIENYEKSLNLNPNNKTTEDVLTQLRGNN